MDYKLTRENFTVQKVLVDTVNEQAVELDYVLPDYCPEIFKVLSCRIYPSAQKRTYSGTKLSYELTAMVRVVYASESGEVSAIEQTLSYDKSVELSYSPKSPVIYIEPSVETKSCRVVNKRRVDIRGVIAVKIRVLCDEPRQAITDAKGGGLQLKKELVTFPSKRLFITKRVTVIDEVEIIDTKPQVGAVLRADASVNSADKKIISGKLLTKGEASVTVLYIPEGGGEMERISFVLPFSQVSDIEGLDERYDVFIDASVSSCTVRPVSKSEPARIECELGIDISCLALRFESAQVAQDVFSTDWETEAETAEYAVECVPVPINESHRQKGTLTYSEGEIKTVLCACAEAPCGASIIKKPGGKSVVTGKISVTVFAKNESGKPICLESDIPFEHELDNSICDCGGTNLKITVGAVTYNLTSSNAIETAAEIRIKGYICEAKTQRFISEIKADESKPIQRDRNCSLKLYYAEPGERPWDIAKRCRASLKAIIEENEIDGEAVESGCMLLIPID